MSLEDSANAATFLWCVVTTVAIRLRAIKATIAFASAEPSSGSVLVPSSSRSTRESGPACRRILMTLRMWEPKVETESAMLCWSPMSAKTPPNTGSALPSSATTCRPDWCMSAASPTVFIATVLPPVFGPVTTSADQSGPTLTVSGTASRPRSGCLARINRRCSPPSAAEGGTASRRRLYRALASAKSNLAVVSLASLMSSETAPTSSERSL